MVEVSVTRGPPSSERRRGVPSQSTPHSVAVDPQSAESAPLPRKREHRVLVVAPEPFYLDRGTPICVRQVLEALVQIGYQVDLLTYPVGQPIDIPGVQIYRSGNPLGISQVPIGFSLRKLLLDCSLVVRLRALLGKGDYDVVHALEESAFPATWFGGRDGLSVIYDMHSSMAEQMGAIFPFRNRLTRSLFRRAERWLLERATRVVGSSGLAERVRLVSPGARIMEWRFSSEFQPVSTDRAAELRKSLSIKVGERVILYSGTFERYQGLGILLGAMPHVLAAMSDTIFVLVGSDGRQSEVNVERFARRVPGDRLRLIARQPREAMPAYLAIADIVVSPRLFGGNLPLKVFDYMAAGRPIIATDIPSHRSVLNEERAVLIKPDHLAMAHAVTDLLGDPARASRLAEAGQAYAREHLAWSSFVRSVDELYQSLEPSRPRTGRGS
jgi:glycosyltransferase involved in cell wall biosynthesis